MKDLLRLSYIDYYSPLQSMLAYTVNPAASKVLAQKHCKSRGDLRHLRNNRYGMEPLSRFNQEVYLTLGFAVKPEDTETVLIQVHFMHPEGEEP